MAASDSHLSLPQYGYDFVVATTQSAINATLEEYLGQLTQPEFCVCYAADGDGNPQPVNSDAILQTFGVDPFSIEATADPMHDPRLIKLYNAQFQFGIKARLGLPAAFQPPNIPDIVTFGGDTSSVVYTLMCSEFQVVQLSVGYGPRKWLAQCQDQKAPWLFTSNVDLRFADYGSAYSQLPPAVQQQIKDMKDDAFGVQQLLFDLDNAGLQSAPTITNVNAGTPLYNCLQNDFLNIYFKAMQANGEPVLGYFLKQSGATPPASSLNLTDFNFMTAPLLDSNDQPINNPTADQLGATTLNYLCATDGHNLPRPAPLDWNWIDPSDESNFDGVVAINKLALRDYVMANLGAYVATNCWQPSVKVTADLPHADFDWSMANNQTPAVDCSSSQYVVQYTYSASASDGAGLNDALGKMELSTSYTLTLDFGDAISITQYAKVYVHLESDGFTANGNVIDKALTDTYTLAVDADGQLQTVLSNHVVDNSQSLPSIGLLSSFVGFSKLTQDIENWAAVCTNGMLSDIPVGSAQNFVFPGGKSFAFKDAAFSAYGDLVAHITYADPS
jgi:hypothetical protein